jgi:hypothetical protein
MKAKYSIIDEDI